MVGLVVLDPVYNSWLVPVETGSRRFLKAQNFFLALQTALRECLGGLVQIKVTLF